MDVTREEFTTDQTHISGVLELPVGTQAQAKRPDLRTIASWLYMVPPFAVRAYAARPEPEAQAGMQHESSVREE